MHAARQREQSGALTKGIPALAMDAMRRVFHAAPNFGMGAANAQQERQASQEDD